MNSDYFKAFTGENTLKNIVIPLKLATTILQLIADFFLFKCFIYLRIRILNNFNRSN